MYFINELLSLHQVIAVTVMWSYLQHFLMIFDDVPKDAFYCSKKYSFCLRNLLPAAEDTQFRGNTANQNHLSTQYPDTWTVWKPFKACTDLLAQKPRFEERK